MTTVLLGTNRFEDCRAIIAYHDQPVLAIKTPPLRITLSVPLNPMPHAPQKLFSMEDGTVKYGAEFVKIVRDDHSFSIFETEHALLIATLLEDDVVHVKLDLRPVGIRIYDDVEGLHIGMNVFSGNRVSAAAVGIALD